MDNADELALAEEFLPATDNGHLLLTTRAHAAGTLAQSIEVEEMSLAEGTLLLLRPAHALATDAPVEQASVSDRAVVESIVREMGGLPLAIDQAGAYIEETESSLASYLQRYRQEQTMLLQRRGDISKQYPQSVATTWSLSFEQVEKRNAVAADAIPEQLILDGAPELGPQLQAIADDPSVLDDAIGTLLRYSFIKRKPDGRMLAVHRLVQAVTRNSMLPETQKQWAERTVRAVDRAFPNVSDYRNWPRCEQYLPHAQACVGLIDSWQFTFPEAARMLNEVGSYLDERAQYTEAEPLYQRAIAIDEKGLGPEHSDLAVALNNLAMLYANQGKYEQAEPLYQRALKIYEQRLGTEHPRTKTIRENYDFLRGMMQSREGG